MGGSRIWVGKGEGASNYMEDANAGADQIGHHCRCQMGPEKTIHIVYCDKNASPCPFLNPPLIVDVAIVKVLIILWNISNSNLCFVESEKVDPPLIYLFEDDHQTSDSAALIYQLYRNEKIQWVYIYRMTADPHQNYM